MATTAPIAVRDRLSANAFRAIYPAMQRALYRSPELEFASKAIAAPTRVEVPTRHGVIPALVFAPTDADIAAQMARGEKPPVHLLTHGGAFILQYPIEEGNVARYLASEIGAYVVIPDYTASPKAQWPVAEQQNFDTLTWIRDVAGRRGWDADRVSVGGPSAGGWYAIEVVRQAIESGGYVPIALTSEYGVADMTRTDAQRTSTKRNPVVNAGLMRLVRETYFKGVWRDRSVSPAYFRRLAEFPPTLIVTAEFDTLKHESNELAMHLRELGVPVTQREFAGVDHGFTHTKPVAVAREAIQMIGAHLDAAYRAALPAA